MSAAPEVRAVPGALLDRPAEILAVPVRAGAQPSPEALAVAEAAGIDLVAHLAREKSKGDAGEVAVLPTYGRIGAHTVLAFGVGEARPADLRKAGAAVARRAAKAASVAAVAPAYEAEFAEGVLLASYSFSVKQEPKDRPLRLVELVGADPAEVERGRRHASATTTARDLANTPSLEKSPAWLATRASDLGRKAGLDVTVLEPKELEARGFGGILAVGSGSTRPPRLIRLDYTPPKRAAVSVVLVGKGITFDSGGLSIKPNDGMVTMKTDMSGGAAVIATLQALPALGLPIRVIGLVAAAENMPSGTAMRPGDVLRHYGGRTVEVLNTDAEGRLVLADALAYAVRDLKPDYVVDLATLTGAANVALGKRTAALYSNDDDLAAGLLAAGEAAGERFWRMPLTEDYREWMRGDISDLKNISGKGEAGSITAALFLEEFVDGRRWAHVDMAGPARADSDDDEITKGGTGFGVRTLLRWLASLG